VTAGAPRDPRPAGQAAAGSTPVGAAHAPGPAPRRAWPRVAGPAARWSFWEYNWVIYSKTIRALARARRHANGRLLDVGCGDRPFAWVLEGRVARYLGVDLPDSRFVRMRPPDVYARSEALPFRAAAFDTVLGLSLLTYLPEPLAMLRESNRVLAPGGTLLLEFTQMRPLRDEPMDFFRFTRYGAQYLLDRAGFEAVEFIPIGGLWTRVGMSLIAGLNRINRGPTRVLTELPVRLLYCVLQLGSDLLDRLFFDPREAVGNLAVARKVREAGREGAAGAGGEIPAATESGPAVARAVAARGEQAPRAGAPAAAAG